METDLLTEYQARVGRVIARNKSVLDILSKQQCAVARVNRSVIKAVTGCGCIEIDGCKNPPRTGSAQLSGALCEECENIVKTEMGELLFYLASLCNALDIGLDEVVRTDMSRCDMLGHYSLR